MPFLPFYIPKHKQLKIVIVGGGYAGIAAVVTILRHMPEARVTIIDPRLHHFKITHLHETFRYPLDDFLVSFTTLENRFGCRHVCGSLILDNGMLRQCQNDKFIVVNDEVLEFDYLLVASGSPVVQAIKSEQAFDLNDFMVTAGSDLLNCQFNAYEADEKIISVIGGGATGIQFLFEIAHFLRRQKSEWGLRLIHGKDRVLNQFGAGFSDYVQARMSELNIDFYPDIYYRSQIENEILLEESETGHQFKLPSAISFLFLGKNLEAPFIANAFGQVMIEQTRLDSIFTAGDCSIYNSTGSNSMTAQSGVRKGMLAARNILRHSGSLKLLEPYFHQDLGYVISLGPSDAVGWLALEGNMVKGMPALMIKEMVEAQYDLLLTGLDTYLV